LKSVAHLLLIGALLMGASPAATASDLDSLLNDIQASTNDDATGASGMLDLAKSMIPMAYAGPTTASFCGIPPESGSEQVRKQIAANAKVVANLPEPDRTIYLAEVKLFQAKLRQEFDSLPADKREQECAALK
jgi:hypothetical protein